MDINKIGAELENKYNCHAVEFFSQEKNYLIKAIDSSSGNIRAIRYRYFIIRGDDLEEILDETLLDYYRKQHERLSNIIY